MSRRQFFIKTKHKRRRHPAPMQRRDAESAPTPGVERNPPPPLAPLAQPKKSWLDHSITAGKLLLAALVAGYGIYFLSSAKPGRSIYPEQSANPPFALPSHPGHRGPSASQNPGGVVEHSLADRLPPTDQSFRDTFGGARSIGPGRSKAAEAGEAKELPEKIKLREDLAGECEVGSSSRFDIEKCLRRHSAPGN